MAVKTSTLALVALLAAPLAVRADPPGGAPPPEAEFQGPDGHLAPPPPRWNDPGEARWQERRDDERDLASVDALIGQLDRARIYRDLRLLRWVDGRARWLLDAEVRESRSELERARWSQGWSDPRGIRRAEWKLARAQRLAWTYQRLAWRLDGWSVGQRRAVLIDLDHLNRIDLFALR